MTDRLLECWLLSTAASAGSLKKVIHLAPQTQCGDTHQEGEPDAEIPDRSVKNSLINSGCAHCDTRASESRAQPRVVELAVRSLRHAS